MMLAISFTLFIKISAYFSCLYKRSPRLIFIHVFLTCRLSQQLLLAQVTSTHGNAVQLNSAYFRTAVCSTKIIMLCFRSLYLKHLGTCFFYPVLSRPTLELNSHSLWVSPQLHIGLQYNRSLPSLPC